MSETTKKKFKCAKTEGPLWSFPLNSLYAKNASMCLKYQRDVQSHAGLVELLLLAVSPAELL